MSQYPSDGEKSFLSGSSCCCAFLCDADGHVIHDFGEQRIGSGESVSATLLVGLIDAKNLRSFLGIVRDRGITLGWEVRLLHTGSTRTLLLHGFHTPCGILIFAPLAPPTPVSTNSGRRNDSQADLTSLLDVAHDMQGAVAGIVSACEYLGSYCPENLNPEQLGIIAVIEASAASLLELSARIAELAGVNT